MCCTVPEAHQSPLDRRSLSTLLLRCAINPNHTCLLRHSLRSVGWKALDPTQGIQLRVRIPVLLDKNRLAGNRTSQRISVTEALSQLLGAVQKKA